MQARAPLADPGEGVLLAVLDREGDGALPPKYTDAAWYAEPLTPPTLYAIVPPLLPNRVPVLLPGLPAVRLLGGMGPVAVLGLDAYGGPADPDASTPSCLAGLCPARTKCTKPQPWFFQENHGKATHT